MPPRRSTKSTLAPPRGMRDPLGFAGEVRSRLAASDWPWLRKLREVNVVTQTQTVSGPPSAWAGRIVRTPIRERARRDRRNRNFTQSRETIGGETGSSGKRSVLLVFRDAEGRPTSNILAGSASIPDAVAKLHLYEASTSPTAPGHSAICIHNVVVSAEIHAKGLTLDRLTRSPLAVWTSKFPGRCSFALWNKGVGHQTHRAYRLLAHHPERPRHGRLDFRHRLCEQRHGKGAAGAARAY